MISVRPVELEDQRPRVAARLGGVEAGAVEHVEAAAEQGAARQRQAQAVAAWTRAGEIDAAGVHEPAPRVGAVSPLGPPRRSSSAWAMWTRSR